MPNRETVEAFTALVEAGDYVGAIEHFYAPDAATRENNHAPVIGRDVLMAKERAVMASFQNIEAARIGPNLIDGDTVAARWKFTFTRSNGAVQVLDEIAWQTWRGNQVIEEHFFYDPAQMPG
jgi:SnoaL-like domain